MKTRRFSRRALACAILPLAPAAHADSALIGDTVLGRPLGTTPYDLTVDRDPRGKSLMIPPLLRTPTGISYDWPPRVSLATPMGNGWTRAISAEIGVIAQDSAENSAKFHEYRDWDDGVLVNRFNIAFENEGGARYLDVSGGRVARDDPYYRATYGRHGAYRLSGFYSGIPHVLSSRARTPYLGAGTGTLTLVPGLVPGNNTPDAVLAATQAAGPIELGLERRRYGLDFESTPSPEWRYFARYTQERREGTRPLSGTLGFNFPAGAASGGLAEFIEPIDYRSHEVTAGVQFARDNYHVNLTYRGSFFRNDIGSVTWDNPFRVSANPTAPLIARGRTDLAPDNDSHNIKLDLAAAGLPMRGSLSGTLSFTRMRQDDDLLPYTVNSGVIEARAGGAGDLLATLDLADWNTTAALPRTTADARIDTWLGQLTYSFSPMEAVTLRARLRHYREDNDTEFTSVNALTGQPGYLAADGAIFVSGAPAFSGLFFPGNLALTSLPIHLRSVPFGHRRDNVGLEGDWRLRGRTTAEFGYERETYHYDHRERGRTWDDRVRLGLHSRDVSWATVRASYEFARRAGTSYDPNPNIEFTLSNREPNVPPWALNELRKLDLASREQHVVNARLNLIVRENMDLMFSGKYVDNDYGAAYGRRNDRSASFNADWNWQPRPQATAFAHYGFQRKQVVQANINDVSAAALAGSGDGSAGGPVFPLANEWQADSRDRSHFVGLGLRYALPRVAIESQWSHVRARHRIRYAFASPAALATPAAVADAGGGMPDMRFRQNALETSLTVPLRTNFAVRLFHRYERGRYDDWHYDGLPLVVGNELYLGTGPEGYGVHVFGVFLQLAL